MLKNADKTMDKIVDLCKAKGFVYPGSEIYGGLANTWDYGPLGMQLKNNIKAAWLKKFVQENKYNVGLDSAILMNPQTWVASGHIGGSLILLWTVRNVRQDTEPTTSSKTSTVQIQAAGQMNRCSHTSRKRVSAVLNAASRTSLTSDSSTSCSRHSRV